MKRRTGFSATALLAAMMLVAAACGQKPGVAEQGGPVAGLGGIPAGATVTEEGLVLDEEGNVIGSAEELGLATGGTGSTGGTTTTTGGGTTGGGETTGGGGGSTGGGTTGGGGGTSGGDATGVSNTTIKIGLHAPLTGAAPVPSDAAEKGTHIYWDWLENQDRDINGRNVSAQLRNDNYNPSQAVAVCKEMVEKDKVFLLGGVAGTDQIQACARYAASVGVPYISAGVTEIGLDGLPNYFANTMTYPDQGPYLADFMVKKLGAKGEKNGMVRFQTPNFEDAHDAWINAMKKQGAKVVYDRAVPKTADARTAVTVAQEMRAAGVENAYVLVSPVWWLQLLKAAGDQQYAPQWVGVGITMTFDTVANIGCRNTNGGLGSPAAKFFSPFPAYSESNRFDPEFRKALTTVVNGEDTNDGDRDNDFILLGWAAARSLGEMLRVAGRDLTREGFVQRVSNAKNLKSTMYPPVSYTPDDRFGADVVHVSQVNCSDGRWHTVQSFVKDW